MTRCLQKAACRSNASFPMLRLRTLNLAFSIWQYFLMIYEVRYVFCLKFLRSLPLNLYPSSWCLAGDKHVAPPDLLWFANACTGRAKKECVHRELKRHRHLHGIYLGSPDLQGRLKVWKCRFFSQIKGWERVIHVFAFVFFEAISISTRDFGGFQVRRAEREVSGLRGAPERQYASVLSICHLNQLTSWRFGNERNK